MNINNINKIINSSYNPLDLKIQICLNWAIEKFSGSLQFDVLDSATIRARIIQTDYTGTGENVEQAINNLVKEILKSLEIDKVIQKEKIEKTDEIINELKALINSQIAQKDNK